MSTERKSAEVPEMGPNIFDTKFASDPHPARVRLLRVRSVEVRSPKAQLPAIELLGDAGAGDAENRKSGLETSNGRHLRRALISEYAASISLASPAESATTPGFSFTMTITLAAHRGPGCPP